jgi:acyl dehydratase
MVKLSELEVGKTLTYVYGPVTREGITKYAYASGDMNNIHIDDDFAVQMRLKGVIAHGLYSFGMITRCLGEVGQVVRVSGQMRGMVRPGDDWIISLTVKSIEGDLVEFDIVEQSKTKIRIEKDGKNIKTFEAFDREWITEKDIAKDLIKTEEVPEGTLYYRLRTAIPGSAIVRIKNGE